MTITHAFLHTHRSAKGGTSQLGSVQAMYDRLLALNARSPQECDALGTYVRTFSKRLPPSTERVLRGAQAFARPARASALGRAQSPAPVYVLSCYYAIVANFDLTCIFNYPSLHCVHRPERLRARGGEQERVLPHHAQRGRRHVRGRQHHWEFRHGVRELVR